jgi:hypothetical protein
VLPRDAGGERLGRRSGCELRLRPGDIIFTSAEPLVAGATKLIEDDLEEGSSVTREEASEVEGRRP